MHKQEDRIAEKTVKKEYQESQENQPERKLETIMPPTKAEWYISNILSTVDRLQGVLSRENLWRNKAVNVCVKRIRRDAERLEKYVLNPIETQNNFEGGTNMSEIVKPEGMYRIWRAEASEVENLTDQEPAKEEAEAPEDQHAYAELPDGKMSCVYASTNNIYTAILYLEEFIAMTTENMVGIADYLKGIKRVNEEMLGYLDE